MDPILAKQIISVLGGIATLLSSMVANPGIYTLRQKQQISNAADVLFGTITTTSGFNFPTSTPTFNDGDVINAGDFNNLFSWVGTRTSTNTDSLAYKLISPTSTNPGHKHTTASVSGTIAIAQGGTNTSTVATGTVVSNGVTFSSENPLSIGKGGTATATYTYGVVVGSSTNPFTTIAPGTLDNVLTSNGSAWVSSAQTNKSQLFASNTAQTAVSVAANQKKNVATSSLVSAMGVNDVLTVFFKVTTPNIQSGDAWELQCNGVSVVSTTLNTSGQIWGRYVFFNRNSTSSQFYMAETDDQNAYNPNSGTLSANFGTNFTCNVLAAKVSAGSTDDFTQQVFTAIVNKP